MASPSLPISALPQIRELIDGAESILKADVSRIKKILADPTANLPLPIVAFTLQEAKDALDLLAVHARQLTRWQKGTISDTERTADRQRRAVNATSSDARTAVKSRPPAGACTPNTVSSVETGTVLSAG